MRFHRFIGGSLSFLILLGMGSCTQKAKTEQPVAADTTATGKSKPVKPLDTAAVEKPKSQVKEIAPAAVAKKEVEKPQVKKEPVKEPPAQVKKEPVKEPVAENKKEPEPVQVVVNPPVKEPVIETPPVKQPEPVKPPKVDSSAIKKPKGEPFYFKVVRKEDGKEIFGNLQLQEGVGASQFQVVKSGETIYLEQPANRRGTYNIVALLPGYRQSSLIFVFANPPIEKGPHNEKMITLSLDKARAGDYIDFNNVHFFKNASIMRPVSQAEMDELVALLKENMRYKIKIYGYCNGTQDRESYTIGTSTDFFAMNPKGNKKHTISSKALSEERAENVKAYLVKQGIAADRIDTKGEGGKVPLYPESGTLGQYNDRIEIEFTKH